MAGSGATESPVSDPGRPPSLRPRADVPPWHSGFLPLGTARPDLDFCLDRLGLRLVKKTVNFDNHDVYHFYYGTERGAPGTMQLAALLLERSAELLSTDEAEELVDTQRRASR